jgi:hypothetical protein
MAAASARAMLRLAVVGVWLVALALATQAQPATIVRAPVTDLPKLDEIASTVAHKTVDAQCEFDREKWSAELRSMGADDRNILGYVDRGQTNVIRLGPSVCKTFQEGPKGRGFGAALNVIAHEASHAGGVHSEPTAACWGLLWPADLARRFFGVEFFTPESQAIIASARRAHDTLLSSYKSECS